MWTVTGRKCSGGSVAPNMAGGSAEIEKHFSGSQDANG